jgi:hypothetical protein
MPTPKGESSGVPARESSSSNTKRWPTSQPVPPCSSGQCGAIQPFSYRILCQVMRSSWVK